MYTGDLGRGRGVVLYIREGITAEQVIIGPDFDESIWCRIKLKENDSLLVGCLYKSPNSSEENSKRLLDMFSKIKDERDTHKLIMGDFNFREINWATMNTSVGETHIASLFVECVRDTYLVQHVKQPTRIRLGNEPSVLDLIFTNEEGMISELDFLPGLGRSDHVLISFHFNCYIIPDFEGGAQLRYNFHRGDYGSIKSDMREINWDTEFCGLDLSRSWVRLTEIYIKLVNEYIPESRSSQGRERHIPFLPQSCLNHIKIKHQKWLKYKYCKNADNFQRYKIARNIVTAEVRKARYNYEKDLAAKIKTDNKIFWSYVRQKTKNKASGVKVRNAKW